MDHYYPLLFGFRDLVAGTGFLAGVAVNGRALLLHDDEVGYWMYGVNPGGLAAGGSGIGEAQRAFRETYRTILFDIAADSEDFNAFEAGVQGFFNEGSDAFRAEWTEAVRAVRAGEITADWLPRADSDAVQFGAHVELVSAEHLEPSVNKPDEQPVLATAVGF